MENRTFTWPSEIQMISYRCSSFDEESGSLIARNASRSSWLICSLPVGVFVTRILPCSRFHSMADLVKPTIWATCFIV